jgi:SAM-dependent methyltransferase
MLDVVGLEDRIALGLRTLPITDEQWERDHGPIVAENLPRLSEMVRASRHAPSGSMLDIGLGYGYSASALRSAYGGRPLVALEHPSRELTRQPIWSALLSAVDAVGVAADALSLPFREGSFAVVAACEIVEHISPPDAPRLASEAARVLQPGGIFVLTTPNLVSLSNRLLIASGRSPLSMPIERTGCVFGHLREYTTEEIQRLLAWAGFDGIGTSTVPRPVQSGTWHVTAVRKVESLLWRAGTRRVGGFIVAWGRKP